MSCKGVANASGKKVQFWVTSRKSKSTQAGEPINLKLFLFFVRKKFMGISSSFVVKEFGLL